jgi:hypothetical protein
MTTGPQLIAHPINFLARNRDSWRIATAIGEFGTETLVAHTVADLWHTADVQKIEPENLDRALMDLRTEDPHRYGIFLAIMLGEVR